MDEICQEQFMEMGYLNGSHEHAVRGRGGPMARGRGGPPPPRCTYKEVLSVITANVSVIMNGVYFVSCVAFADSGVAAWHPCVAVFHVAVQPEVER